MGVFYRSHIPAILTSVNVKSQAAVATTAELLKTKMEEKVPVGAPEIHLKDTIRVIDGPTPYTKYVGVGDDQAFYPHMVEFGTEHSAAHPFIHPSVEETRGPFIASMKKVA